MFKEKREKALLAITLLLFAILVFKSLWLDPDLGTLDDRQLAFVAEIEKLLDTDYRTKGIYAIGLMQVRIIDVDEASAKQLETASKSNLEPVYPYEAKVRQYLLWLIPVGDLTFMK